MAKKPVKSQTTQAAEIISPDDKNLKKAVMHVVAEMPEKLTAPEWDALYDAAMQRANVPDPEIAAQAIADLHALERYLFKGDN